ncbi:class I SAM-dependent methyltransferase [Nocardia seriolae]|nr:methyltransferase domain-containing protein [Nocardia seriolae]MTJ73689.1 methyltransferase domain-containing protein [Nocardia seriolae]MTJ89291.1 methyltransferase domain-containing protein [Nocardia seriolae]MTK33269.1 methyltransferase domain-containing protein [Nocardia seriolae]MTK40535.1 methyltransferase domain-containing protein [Nocardia seriolae]
MGRHRVRGSEPGPNSPEYPRHPYRCAAGCSTSPRADGLPDHPVVQAERGGGPVDCEAGPGPWSQARPHRWGRLRARFPGRTRARSRAIARERADRVLTCCCDGPTIDLACGSGRLADRLMRRGVVALSVDLSPVAVAVTRSRGVPALHRDLFDRLPGTGRWAYAILADGVVGIGGDPVRVLRRARELLAPDGVAIVEFAAAGTTSRVRRAGAPNIGPLPWARIGIDRAPALADAAGLRVLAAVSVAGHDIAWLVRGH